MSSISVTFLCHVFMSRVYVTLTNEHVPAGNPVPEVNQIEWYLNNVRLYQGDENVRFSDNYLTLYRSKVSFVLTFYRRNLLEILSKFWSIRELNTTYCRETIPVSYLNSCSFGACS